MEKALEELRAATAELEAARVTFLMARNRVNSAQMLLDKAMGRERSIANAETVWGKGA